MSTTKDNIPKISVVIPAYNRAFCIADAIQSVLEQTMPVYEIIVVDDGSTDCTCDLVQKSFPDVRLLRFEHNRGAQAARVAGILAARGTWIAFLDSDDLWLPQKIEWQLGKAAEGFSVVHCGCFQQKDNGKLDIFPIPAYGGNVFDKLLAHPGPVFPGMLVKRECFEEVGLPNTGIWSYQEWDTALLLAQHYSFGYVDKPLFIYRLQENSISKDAYRNLVGYQQVVTKWWKEILTISGPAAGYRHFELMARWAKDLSGFSGSLFFYRMGAKLCNFSQWRALIDAISLYTVGKILRSLYVRMKGIYSTLKKS